MYVSNQELTDEIILSKVNDKLTDNSKKLINRLLIEILIKYNKENISNEEQYQRYLSARLWIYKF